HGGGGRGEERGEDVRPAEARDQGLRGGLLDGALLGRAGTRRHRRLAEVPALGGECAAYGRRQVEGGEAVGERAIEGLERDEAADGDREQGGDARDRVV